MTEIMAAIPQLFTLVGTTVTAIIAQPILVVLFAGSFVILGLGLFRKMRNTVR